MKKIFSRLLICFTLQFLVGCSLNKSFLHPTKIPSDIAKFKINETQIDTSFIVSIDHQNDYNPTFLKNNNKDTITLNYNIKSLIFNNSKGKRLNAWLMTPKSDNNEKTIIFFHGNSGSIFSNFQLISPLINLGYNVFIFDYSGFGFSQGKPLLKNTVNDGVDAINFATNLSQLSNTDFLIYGQSLGGQVAIKSFMEVKDKSLNIKGIIIEGTFTNSKEIAKFDSGNFAKLITKQVFNTSRIISEVNLPILIIHSEEDEIIPFEMGEKLFSIAYKPKLFLKIKGPHCFGNILYADTINYYIEKLIQ